MNAKAPSHLFVVVLALVIAAGAQLVLDTQPEQERRRSEDLQSLLGGLGFGPALDLSRCDFSFDPRVSNDCPEDLGPIAGGFYFCPHHACSIFFYESLGRTGLEQVEAKQDAEIP